jgi:hypothetical protein
LPGVPDTWNELLYAMFMKRQMTLSKHWTLIDKNRGYI